MVGHNNATCCNCALEGVSPRIKVEFGPENQPKGRLSLAGSRPTKRGTTMLWGSGLQYNYKSRPVLSLTSKTTQPRSPSPERTTSAAAGVRIHCPRPSARILPLREPFDRDMHCSSRLQLASAGDGATATRRAGASCSTYWRYSNGRPRASDPASSPITRALLNHVRFLFM
jgi:hypothetical protein